MDRITLEKALRRFSRARRGLLNAVRAYRLAGLALAAGILALFLLAGWIPNVVVNLVLFACLALWLLVLMLVALVRRVRYRSGLEEAHHLEQLVGNLNSRVVSAWDFLQKDSLTPLERVVVERAALDLQPDHTTRLDRTERDQVRKRFALVLLIFLALGVSSPFGFSRLLDNFRRSWAGLQDLLFPFEMTLEPGAGQHVYRLGTKVEVGLRLNRPGGAEVRLIRRVGDTENREVLTLDSEGRARQILTSDVEAELSLHFEVGERRSEEMTLIFATPPSLVHMQSELVYPAYTRQPPRSLEGVQPRLLALPGTRISLGFTFSRDLERAVLTWDNGSQLPLEVVGRYATLSLVQPEEPATRQASLQVVDRYGFTLEAPLPLEFERQNDEKPQVLLPRHLTEKELELLEPAAKAFSFGVQASDDFGVTRVLLRWQRSTTDEPTRVVAQGEVERLISPAQTRVNASFEKVFEGFGLRPGDRISFVVEAQDNRTPRAQTSLSRRCTFFVYQENLGDLTVRELGFGNDPLARERIARSTRATAVKEPEGLKTRELVRNEHEAKLTSSTQAPTVRGDHAQATRDYFRLLSGVKEPDDQNKQR